MAGRDKSRHKSGAIVPVTPASFALWSVVLATRVPMITIRLERPEDASQIRLVNELAFGETTEADLVERLRRGCTDSLSLVAEDDAIVGHILFTPVVVESEERRILGMGLAPMAVLPDRQRQG